MELLKQQVEALIFCSEQSISLEEIAASLKLSFDWDLEDHEIIAAIDEIKGKYLSEDYAFELLEISEGYQFLTKKQYYPAVSALIQHKAKKKLSVSQMETLSIIAYRQPIPKSEVEHIRGVSCDYAIQKLLEKELVEISGKSDGPGRPVLYSTSKSFMDYFGIKSVKDLPQLKDLHVEQNEIGQPSDGMSVEDYIPAPLSDQEQILESVEILEASDENRRSDDDTILSDNEVNILQTEFVAEDLEVVEDVEDVEDLEDLEDLEAIEDIEDIIEIPDRRTIFIENELKNEVEEEKSENDDSLKA